MVPFLIAGHIQCLCFIIVLCMWYLLRLGSTVNPIACSRLLDQALLLFSFPAPPLTLETVFDVIKNVQSWRTLGENIYPQALFEPNTIQCQHVSDEACLKAVVKGFLRGKGQHEPSWRAVIWSLYQAKEIQLAEHIRSYAEPVQGLERCMTA